MQEMTVLTQRKYECVIFLLFVDLGGVCILWMLLFCLFHCSETCRCCTSSWLWPWHSLTVECYDEVECASIQTATCSHTRRWLICQFGGKYPCYVNATSSIPYASNNYNNYNVQSNNVNPKYGLHNSLKFLHHNKHTT